MKKLKKEKIDIILPAKIGDAILSLPMLICLDQLNKKYNSNYEIKVYCQPFLGKLFSNLNLFKFKKMNNLNKIGSFLFQSDKAFFLETTSKNIGYFSKQTFGYENPAKKIKYSKNLEYLFISNTDNYFNEELLEIFSKYDLSIYSIKRFRILLELGYTQQQIFETFDYKDNILNLDRYSKTIKKLKDKAFAVFCMEAANGRKSDNHRKWDEDHYFYVAQKCFEDHNIKSVFIGTDTRKKLPENNYMIDLRKKLDLFGLACLLKASIGYIGNDTGPLHIANLMKKTSVGLYFSENLITGYKPIFKQYHNRIFRPENPDQVYDQVKKSIIEPKKDCLSGNNK